MLAASANAEAERERVALLEPEEILLAVDMACCLGRLLVTKPRKLQLWSGRGLKRDSLIRRCLNGELSFGDAVLLMRNERLCENMVRLMDNLYHLIDDDRTDDRLANHYNAVEVVMTASVRWYVEVCVLLRDEGQWMESVAPGMYPMPSFSDAPPAANAAPALEGILRLPTELVVEILRRCTLSDATAFGLSCKQCSAQLFEALCIEAEFRETQLSSGDDCLGGCCHWERWSGLGGAWARTWACEDAQLRFYSLGGDVDVHMQSSLGTRILLRRAFLAVLGHALMACVAHAPAAADTLRLLRSWNTLLRNSRVRPPPPGDRQNKLFPAAWFEADEWSLSAAALGRLARYSRATRPWTDDQLVELVRGVAFGGEPPLCETLPSVPPLTRYDANADERDGNGSSAAKRILDELASHSLEAAVEDALRREETPIAKLSVWARELMRALQSAAQRRKRGAMVLAATDLLSRLNLPELAAERDNDAWLRKMVALYALLPMLSPGDLVQLPADLVEIRVRAELSWRSAWLDHVATANIRAATMLHAVLRLTAASDEPRAPEERPKYELRVGLTNTFGRVSVSIRVYDKADDEVGAFNIASTLALIADQHTYPTPLVTDLLSGGHSSGATHAVTAAARVHRERVASILRLYLERAAEASVLRSCPSPESASQLLVCLACSRLGEPSGSAGALGDMDRPKSTRLTWRYFEERQHLEELGALMAAMRLDAATVLAVFSAFSGRLPKQIDFSGTDASPVFDVWAARARFSDASTWPRGDLHVARLERLRGMLRERAHAASERDEHERMHERISDMGNAMHLDAFSSR